MVTPEAVALVPLVPALAAIVPALSVLLPGRLRSSLRIGRWLTSGLLLWLF